MEYEAVDEGTLAKIVVPEGTQDVAVNAVIAVLAGEGEDVKAAASAAKAAPAPAPKAAEAPKPAAQAPKPPKARGARAASSRPTPAVAAPMPQPVAASGGNRIFSSPLARRLAKDAGIDLVARAGLRPARPRHRPRHRRGEIRQGPARAGAAPMGAGRSTVRCHACPTSRSARSTKTAPTISCRTTACAAPSRSGSPPRCRPSRISTRRSTATSASSLAAREEINAAAPKDKDGKPAYKLSRQRLRHQGAGAGAAARARRQCELDRSRHAQAQAFRHRRRRGAARRADHADHAQRRDANRCRPFPTR